MKKKNTKRIEFFEAQLHKMGVPMTEIKVKSEKNGGERYMALINHAHRLKKFARSKQISLEKAMPLYLEQVMPILKK